MPELIPIKIWIDKKDISKFVTTFGILPQVRGIKSVKPPTMSKSSPKDIKVLPRKYERPTKEINQIQIHSKGNKWKNIEIIFTKQNKVLIYIDGKNLFTRSIFPEQLNLHNIKEKTPHIPIEEWNILRELAEDNSGSLSLARLKDNRPLLERYISNIRRILKDIFQIRDNPIPPKRRNKPYQFKFKLFAQKKVLENRDDIKTTRY